MDFKLTKEAGKGYNFFIKKESAAFCIFPFFKEYGTYGMDWIKRFAGNVFGVLRKQGALAASQLFADSPERQKSSAD